jgi:predicted nucleotidyltransferase
LPYQFGSTTDGTTHADSDLDLAVLARRPLPNLDRWDLQEELAVRVGRDVDLVDLRSASTVMQAQVIDTADLLAEADRTARQEFEMQVCSAYALLNEERAGILSDVQERGRVYRSEKRK